MAARSAALPLESPRRPAAKARTTTAKPAARRASPPATGLAGGVASIVLVGLLLSGVVALNVAALRLNVQLEQLGRERAELRAGNAVLISQLSGAEASGRIQWLAGRQLGLEPAETETYIDLTQPAR